MERFRGPLHFKRPCVETRIVFHFNLQIYEKRTKQKVFFQLSCLVEVLFNIVMYVINNYFTHDKFCFRAREGEKNDFFEIGERDRVAGIGRNQSIEPE